ncbi:uncharacterized protein O3C94_009868 isoform 2-T2 [Discoglossus pictus]
MRSQSKPFIEYRHQDPALYDVPENGKKQVLLHGKMGYLEEELRRGYRQEAVTLSAAMENMTRIYLARYQKLEKEFTSIKWELGEAEKQKWEAQKTQSELLNENWQLVKTLQKFRQSMERHEERRMRRSRSTPEITHWKLLDLPNRHHLL